MPKQRLNINDKCILMRSIKEIVINNIVYKKEKYTQSKEIQDFYRFIKTHRENIQFIETTKSNISELINIIPSHNVSISMYIKNLEFHRVSGPAIISELGNKHYYIDGKHITEEEFENNYKRKQYIRRKKLERII